MKILILTQWFEPESTFKGLLFAKELAARGHEVQVLTGYPNYPGGVLYPGYRIRPWMRETLDGIDVLRVALYPSHDNSGLHRAFNYLSFSLSAAVFGTALIRKPDVIYVYHPPITVGLAAAVIGIFRRTPFVYDIQDLWPDTVAASGMMTNRAALGLLGWACKFVYRRANHITVLSPGFKETLVNRGVPPEKVDVIYNWCDEASMAPHDGPRMQLAETGRFCILFAGMMGRAQGIESVLNAAQICRTTAPSAEFIFIGGGVDRSRLESMAGQMELSNVRFLPLQPMSAMGNILADADALLVHLKDDPLFRITIPSKTQAYLVAGKPIIMGVRGDAADLVRRSNSGVFCEPGNPQSIADAVKELVDSGVERLTAMGRSGRAFYDCELSLSRGVSKFEGVFNAIVLAAQSRRTRQCGLRLFAKAVFDRSLALCGLIILSPVIIGLGVLVSLSMGRPVLFSQRRPGRFGKPFMLHKFRTMSDRCDASGKLLPDAERLTRVGRFLRTSSLDELPQLWNVLRGDISLVGPRPLLMEYLPRYSLEQARRHLVMPGITGWAQINGRNALSWDEKFALDLWYVNQWSLKLDALILLKTVVSVLKSTGIASPGHATMPGFMGDEVSSTPSNEPASGTKN
jgi:lipopolysaccharide/colanic/teichoic acid biosynthesis glycosyltransferase/glycosyltransferase involved in cell wall biosynthesis